MNTFSEIFKRQTKIMYLDFLNDENFDSFETATNDLIKSFYRDLESYSLKNDDLENKISINYSKTNSYYTDEQTQLIEEQLDCERQIEYINVYLNSLLEMKIVYLFKSLELSIKYLIKTAYPNIDVKPLFKWENIKDFFKSRTIDISMLDSYLECVQIKKVNNCIKHNGIITEEIQSIPEFNGQSYLRHEQLEMFYKRINQNPKIFCTALKEKIKDDLYTFTNERLARLAEEFYERMDDKTIIEFIEKLRGKIQ